MGSAVFGNSKYVFSATYYVVLKRSVTNTWYTAPFTVANGTSSFTCQAKIGKLTLPFNAFILRIVRNVWGMKFSIILLCLSIDIPIPK